MPIAYGPVRSPGRLALLLLGVSIAAPPLGAATYRNERRGFCLAQPTGWTAYEGVNGAGVVLSEGGGATISVGALPNQESEKHAGHLMTLREHAASTAEGIGFGLEPRAEEVRVVRTVPRQFRGAPGVLIEGTYVQGGKPHVEEDLDVLRGDVAYQVQLRCRRSERESVDAAWRSVMRSYRWTCDGGQKR